MEEPLQPGMTAPSPGCAAMILRHFAEQQDRNPSGEPESEGGRRPPGGVSTAGRPQRSVSDTTLALPLAFLPDLRFVEWTQAAGERLQLECFQNSRWSPACGEPPHARCAQGRGRQNHQAELTPCYFHTPQILPLQSGQAPSATAFSSTWCPTRRIKTLRHDGHLVVELSASSILPTYT